MKLVHDASTVTPRDKLIGLQQVCELCSVKKSTIYLWLSDPTTTFPRPVRLSARMVRWPETDVLNWVQSVKNGAPQISTEKAKQAAILNAQRAVKIEPGMGRSTLRDQFAMAALQGLLANTSLQKEILARGQSWVSTSAWAWADDMMKLRSA